jgi:hypothetical protein
MSMSSVTGANAPHMPTMKVTVITIVVALLAYHFLIKKGR